MLILFISSHAHTASALQYKHRNILVDKHPRTCLTSNDLGIANPRGAALAPCGVRGVK